jgi:hypothetical protein
MLIESMIYSKLNKKNSKTKTKRIIRFDDENTENINNLNFNYKSYKRLRNLFFLLILLNKKKILAVISYSNSIRLISFIHLIKIMLDNQIKILALKKHLLINLKLYIYI